MRELSLRLIRTAPQNNLGGVLLAGAVAVLALQLSRLPLAGLAVTGPLTLAMLLGLAIGQYLPTRLRRASAGGIAFSRHRLLRLGIVLYGLRISLGDLQQAGLPALLADIGVVISTFALAAWIGVRWLKLDPRTALLVGAGSAVCGAAAILATAPALRARGSDVSVAIATVVLFGTAAMLLYPWLYTLASVQQLFGGSDLAFGRYLGSTIHEVAQVAAAAQTLDPAAAHAAVITKLIRVMLLVPLIFVLNHCFARRQPVDDELQSRVQPPWFALLFLAMPLLNASGMLTPAELQMIRQLDTLLLAMAMAALGIDTQFAALRRSGSRPLLLGALLFLFLIGGGMGITLLVRGV